MINYNVIAICNRGLRVVLLMLGVLQACSPQVVKTILPVSRETTCIEGISGKEFRYLAWGIGADNAQAEEDALKAALYAALAGGAAGGNCVSILNANERETSKEFLMSFFSDETSWRSYVRASNPGRIDGGKRLKMNDGRIKLGVDVVVATKELREMLEVKGIVKKFRFGG